MIKVVSLTQHEASVGVVDNCLSAKCDAGNWGWTITASECYWFHTQHRNLIEGVFVASQETISFQSEGERDAQSYKNWRRGTLAAKAQSQTNHCKRKWQQEIHFTVGMQTFLWMMIQQVLTPKNLSWFLLGRS